MAKVNPRAKPAAMTAVINEKTNGDSQYPVAHTTNTHRASSARTPHTVPGPCSYRMGRSVRKTA